MIIRKMNTLVLGLGNELLADDAVGIETVRLLRQEIGEKVDILESSLSGLALLDALLGYEKAIIIDSVLMKDGNPGKIHEINPQDLGEAKAISGHYAGLPELFKLSEYYELDFPSHIKIFAVEVEDPYTIKEGISEKVKRAIPDLIKKIKSEL